MLYKDGGIFLIIPDFFFVGAPVTEVDSPRLPSHLSEYDRDTLLVQPEVKSLITPSTIYTIHSVYICVHINLTSEFLLKLYKLFF